MKSPWGITSLQAAVYCLLLFGYRSCGPVLCCALGDDSLWLCIRKQSIVCDSIGWA